MITRNVAGILVALLLLPSLAFALEPIPKESGFSGFFSPNVGVIGYTGNTISGLGRVDIDIGNDTTKSLTEEADSETSVVPIFSFELGYNFAETRTRVFIGNRLEDVLLFDLAQQLGIQQEIKKFGVISAGFLFNGFPTRVWSDPYQTDVKREDTDRDSKGARFVWDKIFGLNAQLQFDYRDSDIDDEQSGIALGLSPEDQALLDRNGDRYSGEVLYRFMLAPGHLLVPTFKYTSDDRDGGAMSSDTYNFKLSYLYRAESWSFVGNASIGWAEFDEQNPITDFGNKTREDDIYGASATLFYKNPFAWEWFGSDKISFLLSGAYFLADSNIDFYTTEFVLGQAGLMYRF